MTRFPTTSNSHAARLARVREQAPPPGLSREQLARVQREAAGAAARAAVVAEVRRVRGGTGRAGCTMRRLARAARGWTVTAYYNENDPKAAAWLRELIGAGLIAPGDVDERSIADVRSTDLVGYAQCHFFAGIGGWSYALRLAGWPDDRPVWTGSCPCQPFSAAGQGKGTDDPRHLWPEFRRLIEDGRPSVVFGEQVASKAGRLWLAGVRADLEALGYAVGAADLCSAGVGAPHIRQRLWWVADADQGGRPDTWSATGRRTRSGDRSRLGYANGAGLLERGSAAAADGHWGTAVADGGAGRLADARHVGAGAGHRAAQLDPSQRTQSGQHVAAGRLAGGVGDSLDARLEGHPGHVDDGDQPGRVGAVATGSASEAGRLSAWSAFDLIPCRDGKARRVEPDSFPLAHGVPARVGRLRGYGNAIVPQVAAEFVAAFAEIGGGV